MWFSNAPYRILQVARTDNTVISPPTNGRFNFDLNNDFPGLDHDKHAGPTWVASKPMYRGVKIAFFGTNWVPVDVSAMDICLWPWHYSLGTFSGATLAASGRGALNELFFEGSNLLYTTDVDAISYSLTTAAKGVISALPVYAIVRCYAYNYQTQDLVNMHTGIACSAKITGYGNAASYPVVTTALIEANDRTQYLPKMGGFRVFGYVDRSDFYFYPKLLGFRIFGYIDITKRQIALLSGNVISSVIATAAVISAYCPTIVYALINGTVIGQSQRLLATITASVIARKTINITVTANVFVPVYTHAKISAKALYTTPTALISATVVTPIISYINVTGSVVPKGANIDMHLVLEPQNNGTAAVGDHLISVKAYEAGNYVGSAFEVIAVKNAGQCIRLTLFDIPAIYALPLAVKIYDNNRYIETVSYPSEHQQIYGHTISKVLVAITATVQGVSIVTARLYATVIPKTKPTKFALISANAGTTLPSDYPTQISDVLYGR